MRQRTELFQNRTAYVPYLLLQGYLLGVLGRVGSPAAVPAVSQQFVPLPPPQPRHRS